MATIEDKPRTRSNTSFVTENQRPVSPNHSSQQNSEDLETPKVMKAAETADLLPAWCPQTCKKIKDVLLCVTGDKCYLECLIGDEDANTEWSELNVRSKK